MYQCINHRTDVINVVPFLQSIKLLLHRITNRHIPTLPWTVTIPTIKYSS